MRMMMNETDQWGLQSNRTMNWTEQ